MNQKIAPALKNTIEKIRLEYSDFISEYKSNGICHFISKFDKTYKIDIYYSNDNYIVIYFPNEDEKSNKQKRIDTKLVDDVIKVLYIWVNIIKNNDYKINQKKQRLKIGFFTEEQIKNRENIIEYD